MLFCYEIFYIYHILTFLKSVFPIFVVYGSIFVLGCGIKVNKMQNRGVFCVGLLILLYFCRLI